MTRDEFLTLFAAHAGRFQWEYDDCMSWLRGYMGPPSPEKLCYCPITALATALDADGTGRRWEVSEWDDAAQCLGLSIYDARAIVEAADGDGDPEFLQELYAMPSLRQALVRGMGLPREEDAP